MFKKCTWFAAHDRSTDSNENVSHSSLEKVHRAPSRDAEQFDRQDRVNTCCGQDAKDGGKFIAPRFKIGGTCSTKNAVVIFDEVTWHRLSGGLGVRRQVAK